MEDISGCCGAEIICADSNGHGKCRECGENCTPYREPIMEIEKKEELERTLLRQW